MRGAELAVFGWNAECLCGAFVMLPQPGDHALGVRGGGQHGLVTHRDPASGVRSQLFDERIATVLVSVIGPRARHADQYPTAPEELSSSSAETATG
jgi:hypothetical protein